MLTVGADEAGDCRPIRLTGVCLPHAETVTEAPPFLGVNSCVLVWPAESVSVSWT